MSILKRIVSGIDTISKWTGAIVGYVVVIIMLVLVYEVISRYVFNSPTRWANELTMILFGSFFMLLGGFALYSKAHITMDLFYGRWSPRGKAIADVITALLFFFFCGALLWVGWKFGFASFLRDEHSRTPWSPPLWPFKLMIPAGAFFILLQGAAKFVRDLTMAIRGREL